MNIFDMTNAEILAEILGDDLPEGPVVIPDGQVKIVTPVGYTIIFGSVPSIGEVISGFIVDEVLGNTVTVRLAQTDAEEDAVERWLLGHTFE